MQEKARRILRVVVIVLACLLAATAGWIAYDMNVDRSGFVLVDGVYYYQDYHAQLVTGWHDIDGQRYYFGEDNAMATHWQEIDGKRYYFSSDGTLDTDWRSVDGSIYYLGIDGVMVTGWQEIADKTYHFGDDGVMAIGWLDLDGNRFHFGSQGAQTLGFYTEEDATYYFGDDGSMTTGHLALEEASYYFNADGTMYTGWLEEAEGRSYYQEDGIMLTGWLEQEEGRYYFDETGYLHTGWLELGEYRYYMKEDGTAATGAQTIEDRTYYFSPKGIHVVLVNKTHEVPDDYDPNLVTLTGYHEVSAVCLEPLNQMLADLVAAGYKYEFNSGYRSYSTQSEILRLRTDEYMATYGLDYISARSRALQTVAVPGTSEHHLGLAVDIVGDAAQGWLAQHCWEYGFILRYTAEKQSITGFINEPWHFRYVGTEVSLEMKDSGLCLEEYIGAVPIQVPETESEETES